jgi:hypothetical protein
MEKKMYFANWLKRYPLIGALFAQVISVITIKIFIQAFRSSITLVEFTFVQAIFSAVITQTVFKLPRWFLFISILFPVLLLLGMKYFHFASWSYGVLFILFALTFSHTLIERVPLYLSNQTTHEALKKIVLDHKAVSFLDLGSGLGGVVRAVSVTRIKSTGVESAPMLWLISSLISLITFKGSIVRRNIWDTKFTNEDVIYAFLSPAIMSKLYLKIKAEMKVGSLFISNSFEVPGIKADEIWELEDQRQTKLYFYRIKK